MKNLLNLKMGLEIVLQKFKHIVDSVNKNINFFQGQFDVEKTFVLLREKHNKLSLDNKKQIEDFLKVIGQYIRMNEEGDVEIKFEHSD